MTERFLQVLEQYHELSEACKIDFRKIIRTRSVSKNSYLLRMGEVPTSYAFVLKGLFSYYHIAENGDIIIKKFFAENSLIASTSALIQQVPSAFSIYALEDSEIITYSDQDYRKLMRQHTELAFSHISYLEKNWVVAKENLEISLKYETAKQRYLKFQQEYQQIEKRLKQHQIASFLGVTPTQLSRIRKEL